MSEIQLALKIDVDTDRGTRIGVPALLDLFKKENIKATFLFSLGPDNTGRAIKRVFRKGFLQKVGRTSVVSTYGLRTLLNGVLLPGPMIAKRNAKVLIDTAAQHHEVGIHAYDHVYWQDNLFKMSAQKVQGEFDKACAEFERILGRTAKTAGAAGWQANDLSLSAYDKAKLLYGSDTRGDYAFFPKVNNQVFKTLQIPTTLPTLDELLGRQEYPLSTLSEYYLNLLRPGKLNIMTLHAEIEGMKLFDWFCEFIAKIKERSIALVTLESLAQKMLNNIDAIPTCDILQSHIDGRSGTLAVQQI